jgi:hypothetical protein
MVIKSVYFVQPYQVGTKTRRSLALIIPAGIVRRYGIDISTGFQISVDEKTKRILMRSITPLGLREREKIAGLADESSHTTSQQAAGAQ